VRTLVLSDLHLGSRREVDVLRRPDAREALLEDLGGVDRLVLLGDVVELREGPVADSLDVAREPLAAIGEALGEGAEVVLLGGNHDHALVAPWLEARQLARAAPLGLAEATDPAAHPVAGAVADALRPATVRLAYPGVWLRDDVYATHGHYLDLHLTVPTFERLAAGVMERLVGEVPAAATPADYEAALAPLYAWLHTVARHTADGGLNRRKASREVWGALTDSGPRPLRARALAVAFPMAVRVVNMLGVGPVAADVSAGELRRAGLRAMAEAARRLEVPAAWVVFGHTHRAGPLDADHASEWESDGRRLVNAGCWVHEAFAQRGSPYWPGTVVEVGPEGPPRLRSLLAGYEP
jgi:hypothetical protein